LHVFEWPADGKLSVPKIDRKVMSAKLLADSSDLKFASGDDGTTIEVLTAAPDPIDSVVKLILAK
jgi:alpha-L-fucosidase